MATRDQVYIDIITETKKSIGGLKNLVIGLAAAYAAFKTVQRIAKVALDAAMYAAKVDQIKRSFASMAEAVGQDANVIIADLDRLAGGTINKLDLLTSASRAALFKLPMDKMDDLMKIARASATATGESVKYMFDSIVLGIARGSPKILDNLGILIKAEKATGDYAASIGKTAEELTAAEKTQATMNAVLAAGEDIMRGVGEVGQEITDAERWQILQASVADLKEEIGTRLLPTYREVARVAQEFAEDTARAFEYRNLLRDMAEGGGTLEQKILAITLEIGLLGDRMERLSGRGQDIVKENIKALEAERAAIEDLLKRKQYQAVLEGQTAAASAKAIQERVDAEIKAVEELEAARKKVEKAAEEEQKAFDAAWPGRVAAINAETEAALEYYNLRQQALLTAERERAAIAAELAGRKSLLDLGATALEVVQASTQAHNERHAIIMQNLEAERDAVDETKEKYRELTEQQEQMAAIATAAFTAFGQAFAEAAIEGGEIFKEAMKAGVASAVQALAMLAMAEAGIALAQLNFVKAAALFGAGTLAFAAAAGIRALGEGGIVTKPTLALVGEKGPEEWRPLSKARAMGGITLNVYGSLITEEDLLRAIESRVMGRLTRVY